MALRIEIGGRLLLSDIHDTQLVGINLLPFWRDIQKRDQCFAAVEQARLDVIRVQQNRPGAREPGYGKIIGKHPRTLVNVCSAVNKHFHRVRHLPDQIAAVPITVQHRLGSRMLAEIRRHLHRPPLRHEGFEIRLRGEKTDDRHDDREHNDRVQDIFIFADLVGLNPACHDHREQRRGKGYENQEEAHV